MSIRYYHFQEDAVDWLINTSSNPKSKQTIVLKAPTGSGKTIILLDFINKYRYENRDVAFVWLCPGKGDLEEQSRDKMNKCFPTCDNMDLFDVLSNGFVRGSTAFINWERVTKKGNKAITDGERKNLYERIIEAHKQGIKFIIIIDEEHSNNTSKAKDIIDCFNAEHIIRVSATTISNRNVEYKEIDEQDVINEGLISSAIYVNEGVEDSSEVEDAILIKLADKKRKEIRKAYKEQGTSINPLVLIQFPNGQPEKIEYVEKVLNELGYSRQNGTVAAWLSGDKQDIPEDLVENTSDLAFLFIKQAINTGWDCPRAKILVKLREGSDEAFQIQTIGRIRRMPEQKHYNDNLLDFCYVYTFDSTFKAGLLSDLSKAYIPRRLFLKKEPRSLELQKELKDQDGDLTEPKTLYNQIRRMYVDKYNLTEDKELNKKKLSSRYVFHDYIIGQVFQGVVVLTDALKESNATVTTKTPVNTHNHGILYRHTFDEFKNVLGVQVDLVRQIFNRLFSFKYKNKDKLLSLGTKEYYAFIINNVGVIKEDLRELSAQVSTQNRMISPKTAKFTIPLEELYHFDPLERNHKLFERNAYEEYTKQYVTSSCGKSDPEILFEEHCENSEKVDWFYKNGDSGQNYLSIVYYNYLSKKQKLFYPDYIVKLKDGSIWIIEAKGGQKGNQDQNIDINVFNKFETFKRYATSCNLNWGFVRNMSMDLYLNNTEYVKDLHDEKWQPLDNFF